MAYKTYAIHQNYGYLLNECTVVCTMIVAGLSKTGSVLSIDFLIMNMFEVSSNTSVTV